jgi:hypothetical protein
MSTYTLTRTDSVVTDGHGVVSWLHDLPRNPEHWRIEALVASGDFCEMLAATLEQIATALPVNSVEQYQIQDAVGNLLYVQRHYKLVKRQPPAGGVLSMRVHRQR